MVEKKRSVGILVVVSILLCGWWVWSPQIYAKAQEVTVTTDKAEYEQGETVEITVRNSLNKSIWYVKETCPSSCCNLFRWENNEWRNLGDPMPCIYVALPPKGGPHFSQPAELKPEGSISKQWDMTIGGKLAESVKYRFSFYYGLTKDSYTEKTIYSNGFAIKENKEAAVIITTDKTEYVQGEEVKAELNFEGVIYEWGEYGWSIQKWEDNSWKDIFIRRGCHSYPDCKNADFEEIKECLGYKLCERAMWYKIEKVGKDSWRAKWTWNQTKGIDKSYKCREVEYEWFGGERVPVYGGIVEEKCMAFETVPPGKYKIRFEYATAINLNDLFSREVDIEYAEKEIIIK
jgi:hypothetical protein